MRRSSLSTRSVVVVAAALALIAAGGAAWAVWRIGGSQTSTTVAGSAVELRLVAVPRPDVPLYPGSVSDLRVTVENDNSFPIVVTLVRPGAGATTADESHRNAGCRTTGVSLTAPGFSVTWPVPAGSRREFLLTGAIKMANDSDSACQGAVFGVPLTASGRSNAR